jgi:hypothetical protein
MTFDEALQVAELVSPMPQVAHQALRVLVAALTEASLATLPVSDTTRSLIALLVQRDQHGRAKYGTTLDRTDLTLSEWLQHMTEELLDGAGYALAAKRTECELTDRVAQLEARQAKARTIAQQDFASTLSDAEQFALLRFAGACMATQLGDDLPGDDLQSYAVECGLLQVETIDEPCGEHCTCAQHSDDWPVECYRRTALLQRCFAAMRVPA